MDEEEVLFDDGVLCVECGCETYDPEYLDPPTCKECVRMSEIRDEDD